MNTTEKLTYSECEVEALTGIKRKTLQHWRLKGSGPKWIRAGQRLVRYPATNLLDWFNSQPGGGASDRGIQEDAKPGRGKRRMV